MKRSLRPDPGLAHGRPGNDRRDSGQLPAESASFVGRETELARLAVLLRTSRLVTVTGVGGVGKSRVALRAARAATGRYPDGARLAELSAVPGASAAERLPEVVAVALGAPSPSGTPAGETAGDGTTADGTADSAAWLDILIGYLRDRSMLLVLDTCEHLVDACAILAETILREAPRVTLLAASRQPLDLPGEATYQILPLRVPAPGSGDTDTNSDAVELFSRRAAAAVPGFTVTAENRADVIRLCQRLDGLPLAIELAAVRLRALPLSQLASRCEDGFSLVTGRRRGTVDRHRTLARAIAWSYDLCAPPERALWERLSVFAGPFELDAAERVCAGEGLPASHIAETVVRLVDRSVLLREPALPWEEGETTRYRLLGTMREFGGRQLAEKGQADLVHGQFVARYATLARSFDDRLLEDGQRGRYRKLRAEYPNIKAALEYALAGQHSSLRRKQDGAALAVSLRAYWLVSGALAEGTDWLSRTTILFPGDTTERAAALVARAFLGAFRGHHAEAVADASAAGQIASRLGEATIAARAHLTLALALTFAGRLEEASAAAREAGRRLESLGDRTGLCVLDMQLAHLANAAGDPDAAIARAGAGLDRLGPSGSGHDASGHDGELWLHGCLHMATALALVTRHGKEGACADALGMAVRAARELGDVVGAAFAIEAYAWLAARAGRAERAAWLLGAAARLWETVGGRLAGAAPLEELHRQAAEASRTALGIRYDALLRRGGQQPLEQAAALAADDAVDLPCPADAGPPAVLTNREEQIAGLVASGLSNREIAERMVISKRTVDAHVEHIFAKLRLRSRVQLTVWLRDRSDGCRR